MADEFDNDDGTGDDKDKPDEDFGALTGDSDSGLGNLPPLSDFDSVEGDSEGGLPPMESTASPAGATSPLSGLPPIDDIKIDTPAARPSELETPADRSPASTPAFDTPDSGLDTPEPMDGLGFQDFAADSDFSPETPEIGPGPDSDIETPMFDSAFGGDSDTFGSPPGGTPAPTQAMETPMFDAGSPDTPSDPGGIGFDQDAFGGEVATPGDMGTPIPDFSPDTGLPPQQPTTSIDGPKKKKKKTKTLAGGGIRSVIVTVVVAAVTFAVGTFVGPRLPFVPNPQADELARKDAEIERLENALTRKNEATGGRNVNVSIEDVEKILSQLEDAKLRLDEMQDRLSRAMAEIQDANDTLRLVREDIDEKNSEFVIAQELLEDLKNEMAITNARHEGLISENDRLMEMVGALEEANARRQATREALLHNLDLLTIQIEGGSPLAPQRYSHSKRVAKVDNLTRKVRRSSWIGPEFLAEYTDLYLAEMGIAASREYFFAKIPVHDALGTRNEKWAECLMNGNWSVYFRTIDGKNIGSFENTSTGAIPDYQFREDLPSGLKTDIREAIEAARVDDYAEKLAVLREKEAIYDNKSKRQHKYSSL